MYGIHKSIDIDFAHHVSGHDGACINIHGHTWKFEVGLKADSLDQRGFVVDFKQLKQLVLEPVHTLLDHSLALNEERAETAGQPLIELGEVLVCTRGIVGGKAALDASMHIGADHEDRVKKLGYKFAPEGYRINGAYNWILGGIKIACFPFNPTSERLAEWLYFVADAAMKQTNSPRVTVDFARIYETIHPVESVATFTLE
jgi:6-pyruvoyl tetrahydropterin synthase/QueD family protein